MKPFKGVPMGFAGVSIRLQGFQEHYKGFSGTFREGFGMRPKGFQRHFKGFQNVSVAFDCISKMLQRGFQKRLGCSNRIMEVSKRFMAFKGNSKEFQGYF